MMASVHDVAGYILKRQGGMSAMKLQKLVYYSQAWHLVWDEEPLFNERIEAWANGPVVYEIFDTHRGQFSVAGSWPNGDPKALSDTQRETIDIVCDHYGKLTGQALSALTHSEAPWREARGDLPATARSNAVITPEARANFYGALAQADDADVVDELDWRSYEADMAREYEAEMRREYEPDPRDYI
jgi:uncharacterized phage-associated protein